MSSTEATPGASTDDDVGRVSRRGTGYQRGSGFDATPGASREALRVAIVTHCRRAADRVTSEREVGAPAEWNDHVRPWASRRRLAEARGEREAWATALDRLDAFTRGEAVDADALREALLRASIRAGERARDLPRGDVRWFRARERERELARAAAVVADQSDLDRYSDADRAALRREYSGGGRGGE